MTRSDKRLNNRPNHKPIKEAFYEGLIFYDVSCYIIPTLLMNLVQKCGLLSDII